MLSEIFLPFDLEFTHEAALYLLMARALFPASLEDDKHVQQAYGIIDEMILKGNRIAHRRKAELIRLEGFFRELVTRSEQIGLDTLNLSTERTLGRDPRASRGLVSGEVDVVMDEGVPVIPLDPVDSSHETLNYSFMEDVGISSDAFLALINQMSGQEELAHEFLGFGN